MNRYYNTFLTPEEKKQIEEGTYTIPNSTLLFSFDVIADTLVEKKYQLRVEHNHSDMKWYAYYAGKDHRNLFDDEIDWQTMSDTPTEAIKKLAAIQNQTK